ncbi:MAG: hypothetical protein HXY45_19435 [Syntrophaceae bacterium]|jgi:long-subunit fatty acid transport protein|nr:hypothetical protein [Syntrophaceae bacterium]
MIRFFTLLASFFLIGSLCFPPIVFPQKADSFIQDFKVQALYRSAKLTWKVKEGVKGGFSVQILRADSFEDAPYKEVETVNLSPGKTSYEYVDKSMGSEAKYFYKLQMKETGETTAPLPTRPFFSPPAT